VRVELVESGAHVVVRTRSRSPLTSPGPFGAAQLSTHARRVLDEFDVDVRFRQAGVEVLRQRGGDRDLVATARAVLNAEDEVEFAGRVLVTPAAHRPVVYTENLFVKFHDREEDRACRAMLERYGLAVKARLGYARNAYFAQAPEGSGREVFAVAHALLAEPAVELCHPELVRRAQARVAFPQQWHLRATRIGTALVDAHASVEAAWALADGTGTTIAVIDDGVDVDHEELRGKVVAPRDVTRRMDDARPGNDENHGTACAGVACAAGRFGASGVAPAARLLPVRLVSGLGSQNEADAFVWAADHGADVISCSWGPEDGNPRLPADPRHLDTAALPDATRLAIDYAATRGRGGGGCVVFFAAGNGNESVDNDGYAGYRNVMAVAACNDRGARSFYSDHGRAVWCAFPSSDFHRPGVAPLTPGIWTIDRSGAAGYNPGTGWGRTVPGDAAGNYASNFGGTSSACPGAAGVAALVLSRNPDLAGAEVRDIIRRSCDRIDPVSGEYDADGHSRFYGYGRVNARRAVELARPPQRAPRVTRTARRPVPIEDWRVSRLALPILDSMRLRALRVGVELDHSYVGDLVVRLLPPIGLGMAPIVLHRREGGATAGLRRTYDEAAVPALRAAAGKIPQGTWTLEVADQDTGDTGTLHSFTLELEG
jgi:subtilisin family serine protease/subtilisin-like proprotein convertase family protein